jgi:peroxiredoxin Q/BCP
MKEEIKIGDIAPNFELLNADNQLTRLSEYKGKKLVLYFYPKDDTPGCTTEAIEFTSLYSEFQKLGVEIYGISQDDTSSHKKFQSKYNVGFNLGADSTGSVCAAYNTVKDSLIPGLKKGTKRMTYLINEQGIISYIWKDVQSKGHAQKVLDFIKDN